MKQGGGGGFEVEERKKKESIFEWSSFVKYNIK